MRQQHNQFHPYSLTILSIVKNAEEEVKKKIKNFVGESAQKFLLSQITVTSNDGQED